MLLLTYTFFFFSSPRLPKNILNFAMEYLVPKLLLPRISMLSCNKNEKHIYKESSFITTKEQM